MALLPTVNQGLACELAARGVRSVDELLSSFDEGSLALVRYGDGRRRRRVGGSAGPMLRSARVLASGQEESIARADLPDPEDCVLFDLEGMPAHLDDLEKIYLWGLKVVENGSSRYLHSAADFGPEGDREAWEGFLRNAAGLLVDRSTRRFIHWGGYEKSRIEMYVDRFGDADGAAARVLDALVDFLPVTRNSIAMPIPSYALKSGTPCHPERSEGSALPEANARGPWPATSRRPR